MNRNKRKNFNLVWKTMSHLIRTGTRREIKKIAMFLFERTNVNYDKAMVAKAIWLAAKKFYEYLNIKSITLNTIGKAIRCSPSTISERKI